jgi:hypothetical protein
MKFNFNFPQKITKNRLRYTLLWMVWARVKSLLINNITSTRSRNRQRIFQNNCAYILLQIPNGEDKAYTYFVTASRQAIWQILLCMKPEVTENALTVISWTDFQSGSYVYDKVYVRLSFLYHGSSKIEVTDKWKIIVVGPWWFLQSTLYIVRQEIELFTTLIRLLTIFREKTRVLQPH